MAEQEVKDVEVLEADTPLEPEDTGDTPTEDDDKPDLDNYGGFDPEDVVVRIASNWGWKPKDKLGDDDKWTPPDEFVEAERDVSKALKSGSKRLKHTVEQLTRKINQMALQHQETTKRDIEKMQAEIKLQRNQAIEEGDVAKVNALDERLQEVAEKAGVDLSQDDTLDPDIADWMKASTWYKPEGKGAEDDIQEVIKLVEELNSLDEYAKLSPRFRLAKINREVAAFVEMERPDLIGKYHFQGIKPTKSPDGKAAMGDDGDTDAKPRKEISDVEGDAHRGGSGSKGKTYSSLSEEERRACDSTVDSVESMTKKDWLKSYNDKFGE